jgi:hypothetical protein
MKLVDEKLVRNLVGIMCEGLFFWVCGERMIVIRGKDCMGYYSCPAQVRVNVI